MPKRAGSSVSRPSRSSSFRSGGGMRSSGSRPGGSRSSGGSFGGMRSGSNSSSSGSSGGFRFGGMGSSSNRSGMMGRRTGYSGSGMSMPGGNIQGIIWMIGLAILFFTDSWWPGILILVGVSMVAGMILRSGGDAAGDETYTEDAAEGQFSGTPDTATPAETPIAAPTMTEMFPNTQPETPEYRTDLLPESCAACGGRVLESEVRWRSARSADCAYCGSPLPMKTA